MREVAYQAKLIKRLQVLFPECFILKNPPSENQGIPDILILFRDRWAMLEVKVSTRIQPNQIYFIDMFNEMSFAAFIHPQNEEQVLYDLQSAFGANW
jgi:hypothetical protein